MSIIQQKFEKAKLKLFQQNLMFFGLNATKLKWQASEMSKNVEGCIYFHVNKTDEVADKTIHVNKYYIENPDYKITNLVDLIVHELLHILHRHGSRGRNKRPEIWALATDHVIDRTIKRWNISRPYHQYNIINDLDAALPTCTEEEAYEWLYNNKQFYNISYTPGDGNNPGSVKIENQHGNVLAESVVQDTNSNSVSEQQIIDKDVENFISDARAIHQTLKDRGLSSGNMSEYLDKILKVEIPWERLLQKAIKTNIIQRPNERAWSRPNKFLRPLGLYLPGVSMSDEKDNFGILALHVDSSGSMSKDDLKKGCSVILDSLQYFEKIICIVCDTQIHQVKEFYKQEFAPFYQFIKEGMKGRGGTSHRPVFEWCQKHVWEEQLDEFSLFISFSDCMSDIETHTHTNAYAWTKHIPCIYVSPPHGTTISVDKTNITQIFIN